jgi:hypothetical protein
MRSTSHLGFDDLWDPDSQPVQYYGPKSPSFGEVGLAL